MARRSSRFSKAHGTGVAALLSAAGLGLVEPWTLPLGVAVSPAAVPLLLFVVACNVAVFFPAWSFFLPIHNHGPRSRQAVALTFDDGPDPEATPRLLDLLARRKVKAAFFVVGRNAEENPGLIARMRAEGHEVGNHSQSHDPILMLRSMERLEAEVTACQQVLARAGIRALAFRPPVGITNPRLPGVLEKLGLDCVCFSCRPVDFGNRRIEGLARRVLERVRAGDIVLLHDVRPPPETGGVESWLGEVEAVLDGLEQRRLPVVPVGELLGRPVMQPGGGA